MAHIDSATLRAFLSGAASELEKRQPLTAWGAWRKRMGVPVAVGALGALVGGCGGESTGTLDSGGPCVDGECGEECSDGVDNDDDGVADCLDDDCADEEACINVGYPEYGVPYSSGGTGGEPFASGGQPIYGAPLTGGTGGDPFAPGGTGGDPFASGGQPDYGIPYTGGSGGTGGVPSGGTGGYMPPNGTGGTYGIPFTGGTGGIETGGTGGEATGGDAGEPAGGFGGIGDIYGIPFEEDCSNGLDDDGDTLTDCEDPDCRCGAAGAPGAGGEGGAGTDGTGGYFPPNGTGGAYSMPF